MAEIIRNRTIRPSSRQEASKSYKIDTKNVNSDDTLIVNIDHESEDFNRTFRFKGSNVSAKNSIHFKIDVSGNRINITWIGAQPI
ncbi:MAG: hypothetical protein ACOCYO_05220 [Bacteroidota bacterium]